MQIVVKAADLSNTLDLASLVQEDKDDAPLYNSVVFKYHNPTEVLAHAAMKTMDRFGIFVLPLQVVSPSFDPVAISIESLKKAIDTTDDDEFITISTGTSVSLQFLSSDVKLPIVNPKGFPKLIDAVPNSRVGDLPVLVLRQALELCKSYIGKDPSKPNAMVAETRSRKADPQVPNSVDDHAMLALDMACQSVFSDPSLSFPFRIEAAHISKCISLLKKLPPDYMLEIHNNSTCIGIKSKFGVFVFRQSPIGFYPSLVSYLASMPSTTDPDADILQINSQDLIKAIKIITVPLSDTENRMSVFVGSGDSKIKLSTTTSGETSSTVVSCTRPSNLSNELVFDINYLYLKQAISQLGTPDVFLVTYRDKVKSNWVQVVATLGTSCGSIVFAKKR